MRNGNGNGNGGDIGHYEGLVFKTSVMYEGPLAMEREDIQQILRITVWRAITSYEPIRDERRSIETFVFWCVRNQIKDLVKSKTRRDRHGRQVYIEDLDGELGGRDDKRRGDDDVRLPDSLTAVEREVIGFLYLGYRQTEIAALLECPRREIERRVRMVRRKLADWRPASEPDAPAEVVELEAEVRRAVRRVAA